MDFDSLTAGAETRNLVILGGFHPGADDACPKMTETLILLGPDPSRFWPGLLACPEAEMADPVDAWSRRVIGNWACDLGGKALFPFGDPVQPFLSWALKSGRCWSSPVGMLVHDTQGLMVSFRGALALRERVDLPPAPTRPCDACRQPCVSACPVGALGAGGYDTAACHGFLDTAGGADCLSSGCLARRACPVSPARAAEQSAHHMRYFHK